MAMDSCSFVRLIVLDILATARHFEFLDSLEPILDCGGVQFEPILNTILHHHEKHGFTPSKMGATPEVVEAVFEHLIYEHPTVLEDQPFDISQHLRKEIAGICEVFGLMLNECKLRGTGWTVVGYRSTYHPIIGKVLE